MEKIALRLKLLLPLMPISLSLRCDKSNATYEKRERDSICAFSIRDLRCTQDV
jgi:hypothetical protein